MHTHNFFWGKNCASQQNFVLCTGAFSSLSELSAVPAGFSRRTRKVKKKPAAQVFPPQNLCPHRKPTARTQILSVENLCRRTKIERVGLRHSDLKKNSGSWTAPVGLVKQKSGSWTAPLGLVEKIRRIELLPGPASQKPQFFPPQCLGASKSEKKPPHKFCTIKICAHRKTTARTQICAQTVKQRRVLRPHALFHKHPV